MDRATISKDIDKYSLGQIIPHPPMNTLEEIKARKEELHAEIQKKEEMLASTWESLWVPTKANSKGEMVTHIIANSIAAIDAFLTMRKLISRYGHLFGVGRKKKKR